MSRNNDPMITDQETKTLHNFLALAPEPEDAFSFDELMGYLFGLAMTPDIVLPSEWVPLIFGGEMPVYDNLEQVETMNGCLMQVYNKLTADFHDNQLDLPFDITNLSEESLESLFEWIFGFEEALALRDELWDPAEHGELPEWKKQELYHSLMTIEGLVEPEGVFDFFDNLPDEVFQEAFPDMEGEFESRELQIQMFLLASLPLSIETLQNHAYHLEKKRRKIGKEKESTTTGNSKKKPKKNNIIKVDFSKSGK